VSRRAAETVVAPAVVGGFLAGDVTVMRGAWAVRVHRGCEDGFRADAPPTAWR